MINIITYTVSFFASIFLATIAFKQKKNIVGTVFISICFSIAIWIFTLFLSDIVILGEYNLLVGRLTIIGPLLLSPLILHFAIIFPYKEKNISSKIIKLIYVPSVLFLPFINTRLNVKDTIVREWGQEIIPGVLYTVLIVYLFIYWLLAAIILISKSHKASGYVKKQIQYVLSGIALTAMIGLTTNAILPIFGISYLSIFSPPSTLIFTGLVFYAILKYRLMDIRLVLSKSILYFFLVLFVALSFTFVTFTTAQFFEGRGQVAVTLVVSLVIVIFLDPLKHLLAKWTDKFFYKGKIEYQDVLRQVGQAMARELDLAKLLNILSSELSQGLKLKQVHILISKAGEFGGFQTLNAERYMALTNDGVIASYLKDKKNLVIADELPRRRSESKDHEEVVFLEKLEQRMDELGIALVMPIFAEDQLTALFLVESKLSGGAFTQEDLNFFELLSPQVATALEKSKLFEEVQQAKQNLEVLVEQRTADLQERNRYLIALQTLINLTTRSLDFQKVMQTIADGINENLNFIGGILSFVDEKEKCISIRAISNTSIIQKAVALLPQDPFKYCVSLDYNDNISVQAIKQKKIVTSDKFYDIVAPALPNILAVGIQKLLGMKSIVAVPVYSEEKVIGVINVGLAKPAEQITPVETEMMKALADQVGIVYRNLTLYNEIQKANGDLKTANDRLTKLDEAKSEFLSIASHQLRTPLTGIKGYLSMILEGDYGAITPKVKPVIEGAFQESDRLTRLVNIFLNVSRIESGRFEIDRKDLDFVQLTDEVIKTLKLAVEQKKLELVFHRPDKLLPMLKLDKDKMKDVMLNLVDNAIKYTPKGKIEIFEEKFGDALKVTVKDTGIGIPKGEDRELFKKFVRGSGIAQINTGGSGLGLFIVKKIIEAHGGKVWVESAGKDMGSSFIFTLPMA